MAATSASCASSRSASGAPTRTWSSSLGPTRSRTRSIDGSSRHTGWEVPCSKSVTPDLLGESLRLRFRPRLGKPAWKWLLASAPSGAKPVHAFHVLDVFPKVGLMRAEQADRVLETMDSCRIRWGRVQDRVGDTLVVNAVPLVLIDGKLSLGPPRIEQVTGWRDGHGFLGEVCPGDVVSIHWGWACDVLGREQVARLIGWTQRQLSIANETMGDGLQDAMDGLARVSRSLAGSD